LTPYRIAACDDNAEQLDQLCMMISHALHAQGKEYDIARFSSGESVAESIVGDKRRFDILFLDIIMDEMNGVQTARKIREADGDISIVFITGSPDFVFEGYDVQALHYILKPVDAEKLANVLLYDWNCRYEKNHMDVKVNDAVVRIPFDDIVYMESRGRKVLITTKNGEYETYGALSQFGSLLPSGRFISCHKSFWVNLNYVSRISKVSFTTVYGQSIPISKACYSESKRAFINFIGKRI
jgi:two-component system response regulator LytT